MKTPRPTSALSRALGCLGLGWILATALIAGPAPAASIGATPSLQSLVQRAEANRAAGRPEVALLDYDLAIRHYPNVAELWQTRSTLKYERGDLPGTLADLAEAIRLEPRQAGLRLVRAERLRSAGRLPEALEDITAAIPLDPSNAFLPTFRHIVLTESGQSAAALAEVDRELARTPDSAQLLGMRGWLRLVRGDARAAATDFDRFVALGGVPNLNLHGDRAAARLILGDSAGALADLDTAIGASDTKTAANLAIQKYFIGRRSGQVSSPAELVRAAASWSGPLAKERVSFVAGQSTEAALFAAAAALIDDVNPIIRAQTEKTVRTVLRYTIGMRHLIDNNLPAARASFEQCTHFDVLCSLEFILARAELARLPATGAPGNSVR